MGSLQRRRRFAVQALSLVPYIATNIFHFLLCLRQREKIEEKPGDNTVLLIRRRW